MATVDSIISAESGGDPNARNPNSSAVGLGQFTAPTWIDTITAARPDLVQGKSPDEILALRNDPQLSREMTAAYAAQNSGILSKAGLPVTPGTQYLAHFAGPGGAIGILNADPATPIEGVLSSKAVAANPFLKGKTAGDVIAWANGKVGQAPMPIVPSQPAPQVAPQVAQAPQQPVQATAPQAAAGSSGAIPNYDQAAPFALLPPRPRIDLAQVYANLKRG